MIGLTRSNKEIKLFQSEKSNLIARIDRLHAHLDQLQEQLAMSASSSIGDTALSEADSSEVSATDDYVGGSRN
ncbi:TMH-family membrane domain protein [Chlamydia psittaci GR9]|uniref:TMH-family membrane domain protein n=1 Tax=Chlamydophila parapsittaci TaxID=344886 RepID=A0ABX5VXM8_9CHLA|nr:MULTISPECIES: hypothetical protein [Chlamydia]EPJ33167.1 TMH-family membrane domain protein [Chlamydia psittaci 06-1683]AFS20920.1 TMH-family membrane domain protein [Chlamydia psittaci GR9]AFS23516.1 TMH-family membrane domain protein [Chlamydia psittaci WS/RT/E30]EPP28372.1 TMH-family membrane domain protein [Chlamydia psittaci 08-2626_L3]QDE37004.1 hypothetical protein FI836_01570 [Chlamydophila parapsittaci]